MASRSAAAGNCLAKLTSRTFCFGACKSGRLSREVIQVEERKIVFETRPGVGNRVAISAGGRARKKFPAPSWLIKSVSPDCEFQDLRIGVGDEKEDQFVEISAGVALGVRFPVVGVAFEDQAAAQLRILSKRNGPSPAH